MPLTPSFLRSCTLYFEDIAELRKEFIDCNLPPETGKDDRSDARVQERDSMSFGTSRQDINFISHSSSTTFLNSALCKSEPDKLGNPQPAKLETVYFVGDLTEPGDKALATHYKRNIPPAVMLRGFNDLLFGAIDDNKWADHMFYWGHGGSGLHVDRFLSIAVNINLGNVANFFPATGCDDSNTTRKKSAGPEQKKCDSTVPALAPVSATGSKSKPADEVEEEEEEEPLVDQRYHAVKKS